MNNSLGPVNVYQILNDGSLVDLGPTEGGARIEIQLDSQVVLRDELGTTPDNHLLVGLSLSVVLPLTALTLGRLQLSIPGAELQVTPDLRLWVGNAVVLDLSGHTLRLLLKKIVNGVEAVQPFTGTIPNWITLLKVAPIKLSELSWEKKNQQILEVTFQLYPDDTELTPTGNSGILVFGEPPTGVVLVS